MKIISSIEEIRNAHKLLLGTVGFVPTMGYLHEGHLSLIRSAKEKCQNVVVSIFVNPTQFGPAEDFELYPRNLGVDLALLENEKVDIVWTPTNEALYPTGYGTWVRVNGLSEIMEGVARPEHFTGVATIVAKLFNIIQPDYAFFGQKDAQQVAILRKMTRELNLPVDIVVCPTVRELDGLAMSSRNSYLDGREREAAAVLYRGLQHAKTTFENGENNGTTLCSIVRKVLLDEPLIRIDYICCVDQKNFRPLETVSEGALLCIAVYIGKTRLIDNISL